MACAKRQESSGATTTTLDMEWTSEVFGIQVWSGGVRTLEEELPTTHLNFFKQR